MAHFESLKTGLAFSFYTLYVKGYMIRTGTTDKKKKQRQDLPNLSSLKSGFGMGHLLPVTVKE